MSCAPFLMALSSSGNRYDSVSRESSVHSMTSSSPLDDLVDQVLRSPLISQPCRPAKTRLEAERSLRKAVCAAVRAVHELHALAELRQLWRRERPDEVLLLQELEEGGEPAVVVRAAEVLEARRALHVLRQPEAPLAVGALHQVRGRGVRLARMLADEAKQPERRSGRQRQALAGIEPERLAGEAEVEHDRAAVVTGKRVLVHGSGAARAVHGHVL
jgi:hypothetical protein